MQRHRKIKDRGQHAHKLPQNMFLLNLWNLFVAEIFGENWSTQPNPLFVQKSTFPNSEQMEAKGERYCSTCKKTYIYIYICIYIYMNIYIYIYIILYYIWVWAGVGLCASMYRMFEHAPSIGVPSVSINCQVRANVITFNAATWLAKTGPIWLVWYWYANWYKVRPIAWKL